MQQFIFPKNSVVPFALQNRDKQPKGNTVYNAVKNKHIHGKILGNVTGKTVSWRLIN